MLTLLVPGIDVANVLSSRVSHEELGSKYVEVADHRQKELIEPSLPLVVNTWTGDFSSATERAWEIISSASTKSALLDAVEKVSSCC